jgi:hypothetical protein
MLDYKDRLEQIAKRVVALRDHGRVGANDCLDSIADDAEALVKSQMPRRGQVPPDENLDPTILENTAPQGWLVSECDDGVLRIQKYDDDPNGRFETDSEAIAYVVNEASLGSKMHRRALMITSEFQNPEFLLATIHHVVDAVRRIDHELDDPHGDGSGRDSESPTGDSYNELWDCLDPLFSIVDKVLSNKPTADA